MSIFDGGFRVGFGAAVFLVTGPSAGTFLVDFFDKRKSSELPLGRRHATSVEAVPLATLNVSPRDGWIALRRDRHNPIAQILRRALHRRALSVCGRISACCGRSSMVERKLPKLETWVRVPSPAPIQKGHPADGPFELERAFRKTALVPVMPAPLFLPHRLIRKFNGPARGQARNWPCPPYATRPWSRHDEPA